MYIPKGHRTLYIPCWSLRSELTEKIMSRQPRCCRSVVELYRVKEGNDGLTQLDPWFFKDEVDMFGI